MSDPTHRPKQQTGFTKAALDYADTLLDLQKRRYECLLSKLYEGETSSLKSELDSQNQNRLPQQINITADSYQFEGGGWSAPYKTRKHPIRWMKRLAGLLIFADMAKGGLLTIEGSKATRRRFVNALDIEIAGHTCTTEVDAQPFGSWRAQANIPPISGHAPHLLTLSTIGLARRSLLSRERSSLAISGLKFSAFD